VLNNTYYAELPPNIRDFSEDDEQIVEDYYLDLVCLASDCIKQNSYNCLGVLGNYIMDVTKLIMNITGDSPDDGFLQTLLVCAVEQENYQAIDIILTWDMSIISCWLIDDIIDSALNRAVELNNLKMFDYLIGGKRGWPVHHKYKLIILALANKNYELVKKTIDTYDIDSFPKIDEVSYATLMGSLFELPYTIKQVVQQFLSKLTVVPMYT
jgi:hypothetical protein